MIIAYILIGAIIAIAGGLASSLFWLKKQKYAELLQDMGKKHEVEKIILQDRINELLKQQDIESKYRNSQGFFTHKKVIAADEDK